MQTFVFEITKNFPSNIKKDVSALLASLPYDPIWQSIGWQLMLRETGYAEKSFFVGIYENKELLSYALIEKRWLMLRQYGMFCVGWPIYKNPTSLDSLSNAVKELGKKERGIFVQCEPLVPCELSGFENGSYKRFIEPYTAIIDLTKREEEILANMKQKGRYNIKVAERSWVTVEFVPFSTENLGIFYSLLSETTDRDGFAVNSKRYFETFLQYLEKEKLWGLAFARWEDEVIAAGIFVFSGKTTLYYYGASSSDNTKRRYMASYLLQWEMIREAKRRECTIFDFLGIAHPDDSKSHLAGVTDFKLKLTNEIREWPKSQLYIASHLWFSLLKTLRYIRNKTK